MYIIKDSIRFKGSVQLLSCVQFFATPWTAVCQASLLIQAKFSPPAHSRQVIRPLPTDGGITLLKGMLAPFVMPLLWISHCSILALCNSAHLFSLCNRVFPDHSFSSLSKFTNRVYTDLLSSLEHLRTSCNT